MELFLGFATIASVVAVILALRKVLKIYGITIDNSASEEWEYGYSIFNDYKIGWHPKEHSINWNPWGDND